jgi:hypothetical protein
MTVTHGMTAEAAKQLREPFAPEVIGKLPRVTCKDCRDVARQGQACGRHERKQCKECGNYMTSAHMHLDYVGHAAVTDRLIRVDPAWTWEPMAVDPQTGAPLLTKDGGLWINLTVLDVTRPGYGDATGGGGMKEVVGDAIRNAAMRFGVALDLWSKQDLPHIDEDGTPEPAPLADTPKSTAEQAPFDPGKDLLPNAIQVDANIAKNLAVAFKALDPTVNWSDVMTQTGVSVRTAEFKIRLANTEARIRHQAGEGEFPPADEKVIVDAFAWAFNGVHVTLPRIEAT